MKISFSLETVTVAKNSLHVHNRRRQVKPLCTLTPPLGRYQRCEETMCNPEGRDPNNKAHGLRECSPGFGSQDTTHQPLLPSHLLTKPTGLGFSDVLSAVSNISLNQKLGTSANKLIFKNEQEKENLG